MVVIDKQNQYYDADQIDNFKNMLKISFISHLLVLEREKADVKAYF